MRQKTTFTSFNHSSNQYTGGKFHLFSEYRIIMSNKKHEIPVFSQPIIETHCHLDYLEEDQLRETVQQAHDVNVERIITIAVSPSNLSKVQQIAEQFERVWFTQGIHPHDASEYNDDVDAAIRQGFRHQKCLAIGEIGLDYFYDHTDRKVQQAVFERQLQIAVDADLPVVIHSREADDDTQAILANFSHSLKRKGVIHSFTSGQGLANFCLDEGFHLGFNGIITFNKAENVREILRNTPLERILLETDSPYLTPIPFRGKQNAPFYIPFVAQKVADVKEVGIKALLEQCYQNSVEVFWR